MKRRAIFAGWVAGLAMAVRRGRAQDAAQFQHLSNPPRCPLCQTAVTSVPVALLVADDAESFSGNGLPYRSLVCPKDGLIFCVQE